MKIDFNNPTIKSISLTIIFYLSIGILIPFLNYSLPGDMCNPGFGFMLIVLLPFLSFILFVINFKKTYDGNKANKFSSIIHFAVFIFCLVTYLIIANR